MIINYPTGFYMEAINLPPGVASNITFTISSTVPPRSQLLFVKTPVGLSRKRRSPRVYTDQERRATVSQLAFSVSTSTGSIAGNGMKQYEVGQVLDFGGAQSIQVLNPMLVASTSDIRHDTNLMDYGAAGIDAATQAAIESESATAFDELTAQLNDVVEERKNYEIQSQDTQKLLNEVNKILDGLRSVVAVNPTSSTLYAAIVELEAKQTMLLALQESLIVSANDAATRAIDIQVKANKVAQLVR